MNTTEKNRIYRKGVEEMIQHHRTQIRRWDHWFIRLFSSRELTEMAIDFHEHAIDYWYQHPSLTTQQKEGNNEN